MSELQINVNFEKKESLKKGLDEFAYHMDKYYKYDYNRFEDTLSVLNEKVLIETSEFKKYEVCKKVYAMGGDSTISQEPNNYDTLSQIYLILKALEFGLEDEVVKIVESLLAHIKKIDDFYEVWYIDERYLGFDILFTLAYTNPKYTYMMSKYITSDWDDQSLNLHYYFYMMYEKYGASEDIINAISYLNYGIKIYEEVGFLSSMKNEEDSKNFYDKLKKDKKLYELLKLNIIKNIDKYNGEDLYDSDGIPLIEIYFAALGAVDIYDEEEFEEFKKEKIHGKTIGEELEELKQKLDKEFNKKNEGVNIPIDTSDPLETKERTKELLFELFKYCKKTQELELYLNTGENEECLNDLKRIDDKSLKKIKYELKEQYPVLYDFIQYHGFFISSYEIEVFLELYTDKVKMLRLLNILLKITVHNVINLTLIKDIVTKFELMSLEEYEKRYINKKYLLDSMLGYYDPKEMRAFLLSAERSYQEYELKKFKQKT